MRRLPIAALLCVAVAVAAVLYNPWALLPAAGPEPATEPRETVTVTRRDLESTFEANDGEIAFTGERPVIDPQSGIISWVVSPETTLQAGQVLYERGSQPVVLLAGDVPAWRTLSVDDVGVDVAQLETNLVALGYGDETELHVDETFTAATATVVKRWQADLGIAETGVVALGDVVFGPAPARVGAVSVVVGDQVGGEPLLSLSTVERQMVFTVSAETVAFIRPGSSISARLPDRSTVTGLVETIAPNGAGISRLTAALVSQDAELPAGDSIPVTVTWSDVVAANAVTVPASALIRLDQGVYAVETVADGGTSDLTIVEVGAQVGSQVQILSGVVPEATVVAG